MKKSITQKIKEAVAAGENIPTAVIEYNFELPKSKFITSDNFYGVKAKFNDRVKEGEVQLTYKM